MRHTRPAQSTPPLPLQLEGSAKFEPSSINTPLPHWSVGRQVEQHVAPRAARGNFVVRVVAGQDSPGKIREFKYGNGGQANRLTDITILNISKNLNQFFICFIDDFFFVRDHKF